MIKDPQNNMIRIRTFKEITDVKTVHLGADWDGAPLPKDMKDIADVQSLFFIIKRNYHSKTRWNTSTRRM